MPPPIAKSDKRKRPTKAATVTRMLRRAKGASIAEIAKATDWQPHSCRAFLTGVRKRGNTVTKEQRSDRSLAYRITIAAPIEQIP
jgi:hypothetical protein